MLLKIINVISRQIYIGAIVLCGTLSSCGVYPRILNFPYDPGGRSLNSPAGDINPQISGRYIVFSSDREGRQDIYLYDSQDRRLIDLPGINALDTIASHPAISQDGNYIVFCGSREGRTDIYLYNKPTRQLRNLTEALKAEVRNPTISADGNMISFEAGAQGQWNIMVIDRAGNGLNIPDVLR